MLARPQEEVKYLLTFSSLVFAFSLIAWSLAFLCWAEFSSETTSIVGLSKGGQRSNKFKGQPPAHSHAQGVYCATKGGWGSAFWADLTYWSLRNHVQEGIQEGAQGLLARCPASLRCASNRGPQHQGEKGLIHRSEQKWQRQGGGRSQSPQLQLHRGHPRQ